MKDIKEKLLAEIEDFREMGHKFYNGEMSMMDFKHASGGMGVYAHKGGKTFMVRLRIPSGIISVRDLNLIYGWAEKYGLDKLHFTTRQAVQYHGISIDDVCDIMKEALDEQIYTRGSGGNFPRNVALSPLAGVDKDEPFDPTPYAIATGNYFMERITTYKLPRKLKVSYSNTERDTAHCTVQDIGFLAINKDGENYFKLYLGGGLGRNPRIALVYPELVKPNEVLYYVEGMVNFFKAEGNYENRAKARVRYIVEKLGEDDFIKVYKEYVDKAKKAGGLDLDIKEPVIKKKGITKQINDSRVYAQKQEGLYSVYIHPIGGQIKIDELKELKDLLNELDAPELRLAMTEGVYVRDLNGDEAEKAVKLADKISGKTSFEYSVSCIGVPTCQMGIGNSQETLNNIISYVRENAEKLELLPRFYISGCGNSCGVHEIAPIGFTAKRKRVNDVVEDIFEMHVNGSFDACDCRLGEYIGDILKSKTPEFMLDLYKKLECANKNFDQYFDENEEEFRKLFEQYKC